MRDVVVVLSDLRSLYNVGSFFRTADGAGVSKIYCCGITGTPKNQKLWKVSLGAEQTVAWEYVESTEEAIEVLRKIGYQIIAAELSEGSIKYNEADYSDKVAVVFGAEVDGLSQDILQLCDQVVHLPMRGKKESLNVAVVGGVLIYYLL
ncbi:MAG: RNA methyltransferase [bacterium]|nr:RNA methyltransferase [bacterium]